jgi:hypothetical protein
MVVKITKHLQSRFRERFASYLAEDESVEKKIKALIDESVENRQFLNNFAFCEHLYEKYGYASQYKFLVWNNKIVFVVKEEGGRLYAVTCIPAEKNFYRVHTKFRKKKEISYESEACLTP